MKKLTFILCGALGFIWPLSIQAGDPQAAPPPPQASTPASNTAPAAQPVKAPSPDATQMAPSKPDSTSPAVPLSTPPIKPVSTPADTTPVAAPAAPAKAPAPTGDNSPVQYNVDLPTGDQRQPVYFTKDMTMSIGSTQIGFYGFVKFDYMAETRITGPKADVNLNTVPLSSDRADRHTQGLFDARTSRIGIKIEDSSKGVLMKGAIEADFNAANSTANGTAITSNSRLMRIRVAYASAELPSHFYFLVGQYYSLLMHYPEISMPTWVNVINNPAGTIDSREPQARVGYKQYFSKTSMLQYAASAEMQGYNTTGTVTPQGGDTAQGCEQKWPLFQGRIAWLSDSLKWETTGSGSKAYAITDALGHRVSTPVWGVTSTASYTWDKLMLFGTLHHFVGLTGKSSGYFNQMALINNNTALKAVKANGAALGFRYDFLMKKLWVDMIYGMEHCGEIPGTAFSGSTLKKIEDFRANIVGAFWKHWQIGVEYERVYVKSYNHLSGCVNTAHIGVWYIFGQP